MMQGMQLAIGLMTTMAISLGGVESWAQPPTRARVPEVVRPTRSLNEALATHDADDAKPAENSPQIQMNQDITAQAHQLETTQAFPGNIFLDYNNNNQQGLILVNAGMDDGGSGAKLEPVGESLRAQLGLPAGQGLLVSAVDPHGPAARVGLAANDLLLTLDDKPLAKPEDLTTHLKEAGEKPVKIRAIRAGKPLSLDVRPVYRVTLGVVSKATIDYYIGIPVNPVDEALRAHLDLPAGEGLVVANVQAESPAAKAGLKAFDILLSFGDHPITDAKSLVDQVQATQGKPASVKVLRSGKPLVLQVTPEKRKPSPEGQANPHATFSYVFAPPQLSYTLQPMSVHPWVNTLRMTGNGPSTPVKPEVVPPPPSESQLAELIQQVKALRDSVERLQRSIKEKDASEGGKE